MNVDRLEQVQKLLAKELLNPEVNTANQPHYQRKLENIKTSFERLLCLSDMWEPKKEGRKEYNTIARRKANGQS